MTREELEKEAEEKYCKGCKWRIEQCLWAWRKTNGLKEPNEKNCSCKEVPAYLAGAEPREKRIAELIALINAERERQEKCDDVHLRKIADLEKENAELKEEINKIAFARGELEEENAELKGLRDVATLIRANNDTVITLMQLNNMLVSKSQQLTKAKEIIKTFCGFCSVFNSTNGSFDNLIAEAEQFLSEVEK